METPDIRHPAPDTRLIECIPNFSEGRDPLIIGRITEAIEGVAGIRLLHVDTGHAAHRTVVTFAGEPEAVVEAAFRAIRTASRWIDLRYHKGAHPRIGATDVCPLVPLSGITAEETVPYAKQLASRVGRELQIPVYLYEHAASRPDRKNLAAIRRGEYEGLEAKLREADWQPDFGPSRPHAAAGATVIGVREFLVAYNVNLNTADVTIARAIAADIREQGRIFTEKGKIVTDEQGRPVRIPGSLSSVKAIGWYIGEYGIAQVSMNLTDIDKTPVHLAFEECRRKAEARGVGVTGSELVGLMPLRCLLEAGRYFRQQRGESAEAGEETLVKTAVSSLGLDDLSPFDPQKKVIEYVMRRHR